MKQPIITAGMLALGLGLAIASTSVLASNSEMQERFREEGKQLDLTGFLQPDNDARSRSFFYGGPHEHDFTVKEAGTYLFESRVTGGQSEDYRVAAVLLDDRGEVIARAEALGQNGGLAMRQRLQPGDYTLRVEGQRYGTRGGKAGEAFYVTVSGLDDRGRRKEEGVSGGQGLVFTGSGREGRRSVFVRDSDAVAAIAPPAAEATGDAQDTATARAAAPPAADPQPPASEAPAGQAADSAAPGSFETIVTDVKIRARGEVLTFDVVERGTIAITTSTYPSGEEDTYRIVLEVLDENGRVVAKGAGEGFDGNVDLRTELSPGRYRIRVQGQKYGSVHSGVNNYELKVTQLDRQ